MSPWIKKAILAGDWEVNCFTYYWAPRKWEVILHEGVIGSSSRTAHAFEHSRLYFLSQKDADWAAKIVENFVKGN